MNMKMKDRLPGMQPGIDGQAVAAPVNIFLAGNLTGDQEQASTQEFVLFTELVQGGDVAVGHDQDVGTGGGVGIPKGGDKVILIEHPCGRSILDEPAKWAGRGPGFPTQQVHHELVDGLVVVDKNTQATWFPHL
jgi:hypothetical protein